MAPELRKAPKASPAAAADAGMQMVAAACVRAGEKNSQLWPPNRGAEADAFSPPADTRVERERAAV